MVIKQTAALKTSHHNAEAFDKPLDFCARRSCHWHHRFVLGSIIFTSILFGSIAASLSSIKVLYFDLFTRDYCATVYRKGCREVVTRFKVYRKFTSIYYVNN